MYEGSFIGSTYIQYNTLFLLTELGAEWDICMNYQRVHISNEEKKIKKK